MSIKKTIGGDRVGSGKKMQAKLNNYYRSTHNLSEKFASSMGAGILYPCLCKLAMRGDTFDITIDADARTIPTMGPLFGSFKLQLDVYQCPVRLYQALLHNNPLAIGLNMSQIKFPVIRPKSKSRDLKDYKFSNSCLLKYLGISGIGTPKFESEEILNPVYRDFNAIPALAYYDIFKNYYANKQEEKGYVITPYQEDPLNTLYAVEVKPRSGAPANIMKEELGTGDHVIVPVDTTYYYRLLLYKEGFKDMTAAQIKTAIESGVTLVLGEENGTISDWKDRYPDAINTFFTINEYGTGQYEKYVVYEFRFVEPSFSEQDFGSSTLYVFSDLFMPNYNTTIKLREFDLSNIDDMRYEILSHHTLGQAMVIQTDANNKLPYATLVNAQGKPSGEYANNNCFAENGLVLKTYQNDIFNNWLNAEWIEGENGIAELSKVEVVDGAFTMDALNFAQKLYNMLNRVAIAGATYEDWQDVVYEEVKRKQIESPIYCGGISQEVVFDEIVQTAPAEGYPLGELGGRGRLADNKKGGKLHIKCDEACFIIAIVSLTPRIFYTQGNEFYMTDVLTMDDVHKPGMDGIGFQDLPGERLGWWDTVVNESGIVEHRSKVGKLPSWIEYMTSYDRAYGDFAETEGKGYMILNRNYERDEETGGIKDATTYIDPSKYNYAFAVNELEAQNFWVEINFGIKARRLMSARLIPNV